MPVTRITKEVLGALRKDVDAALAAVGAKYGLSIKAGNASYAMKEAHIKLHVLVKDASGAVHDPYADNFTHYASIYGLRPEDLGRGFTSGRKRYVLSGLDGKARKYPFLAKDESGTLYKFTAEQVKAALK